MFQDCQLRAELWAALGLGLSHPSLKVLCGVVRNPGELADPCPNTCQDQCPSV